MPAESEPPTEPEQPSKPDPPRSGLAFLDRILDDWGRTRRAVCLVLTVAFAVAVILFPVLLLVSLSGTAGAIGAGAVGVGGAAGAGVVGWRRRNRNAVRS